jgi:hypothetical protein
MSYLLPNVHINHKYKLFKTSAPLWTMLVTTLWGDIRTAQRGQYGGEQIYTLTTSWVEPSGDVDNIYLHTIKNSLTLEPSAELRNFENVDVANPGGGIPACTSEHQQQPRPHTLSDTRNATVETMILHGGVHHDHMDSLWQDGMLLRMPCSSSTVDRMN